MDRETSIGPAYIEKREGDKDMGYQYEVEKENLFTDEGQRLFIHIRDNVKRLLTEAGAVKMQHAIANNSGSSWQMLACVDRMVELGELQELTSNVCGQDRVFVAKYKLDF